MEAGGGGPSLSRRNSVRSNGGGSRRGSSAGGGAVLETVDLALAPASPGDLASVFGQMKPLKKSKPVSTVKIKFMGKPMVRAVMCILPQILQIFSTFSR